jgi:hypothetical protein
LEIDRLHLSSIAIKTNFEKVLSTVALTRMWREDSSLASEFVIASTAALLAL